MRRSGMTLYEVVLALAIFAGALAALGPLASTGTRAAVRARQETQAILRCESKLAEILAGIEPLTATSGAAFEDESPGWSWSLSINNGPRSDLLIIEVAAAHSNANGAQDASYSIVRLLRNPDALADLTDAADQKSGSQSTSSSTSSSTNSASSGTPSK